VEKMEGDKSPRCGTRSDSIISKGTDDGKLGNASTVHAFTITPGGKGKK